MIVNTQREQVVVQTNNLVKQFTIKVDRKSFETLYKKCYTDREGAVVREIASNARDSHVVAGKADLPIKIHLPNNLEPFLEFIDHGVGMSPDFIENVYTNIFESTKTDDQSQIGAWGLGSKTPYAYTDQFTVESKYNGTKYTYICFINDEGIPCITKVNEQKCDQCNGVSIKIPVKQQDFQTFNSKVVQYLKYFDPFPTVVGQEIEIPKREPWIAKKEFVLYDDRLNNTLVMGGVPYNIETYRFRHDGILNIGVDLLADIGEVDINPNREFLDYTQKTIDFINKRLDQIREAANEWVEKEIAKSPSLWQAHVNYQKIYHGELRFLIKDMTYQGQKLHNCLNNNSFSKFPKVFTLIRGGKRAKETSTISDFKCPIFVITDKKWLRRVKHFLETSQESKCYILDTKAEENSLSKDKPNFYKNTGITEVLQKTHRLPEPPRKPPAPRAKRLKFKTLRWKGTSSYTSRFAYQNWETTEVELKPKKKEFFVVVSRYHLVGHFERDLQDKLALFKHKLTVVGILPSQKEKFIKNGWREFFSFADDYLNKKLNNEKLQDAKAWAEFNYKNFINGVSAKFDSNSPFGEFLSKARKHKKVYGQYDKYVQFAPYNINLNEEFNKMVEHYPLLSLLNNNQLEYERDNVLDYIKMIDKRHT